MCVPVQAETVELPATTEDLKLSPLFDVFYDPSNSLTAQQVMNQESGWNPSGQKSINKGFVDGTLWFRVELHNRQPFIRKMFLEIAYPSIDDLQVMNFHDKAILSKVETGDMSPFNSRPLEHNYFVFPIEWLPNETQTLLIRTETEGVTQLPITLWNEQNFHQHNHTRQLLSGMFFGIMFVMVLYNLALYIGTRDNSHLYYVGFVFSITLFTATLMGYSFQYIWPETPQMNQYSIILALAFTLFFATLFAINFLDLLEPGQPNWLQALLIGFAVGNLLFLPAVFFISYNTLLKLVMSIGVFGCGGALCLGIYSMVQKKPQAPYYILAWSVLFMSGIVLAANKFSIIDQTALTDHAVHIGTCFLMVLLSFAMAERINAEKRHRFKAQLEALEHERQARESEQKALYIERTTNQRLEQKVKERTAALAKANEALKKLSAKDSLTGLYNRRHLDEALLREYTRCKRQQSPIAFVIIDIDHFKAFNDSHGHQVGDDCLRLVAAQLEESVNRPSDVVARYGGEEFCIVLPETDKAGSLAIASRVHQNIGDLTFRHEGKILPVTVSIGVSVHPPGSETDFESLVKEADTALYVAKENGRNQVQFYQPPEGELPSTLEA